MPRRAPVRPPGTCIVRGGRPTPRLKRAREKAPCVWILLRGNRGVVGEGAVRTERWCVGYCGERRDVRCLSKGPTTISDHVIFSRGVLLRVSAPCPPSLPSLRPPIPFPSPPAPPFPPIRPCRPLVSLSSSFSPGRGHPGPFGNYQFVRGVFGARSLRGDQCRAAGGGAATWLV